jgi:cation diffusion facilitator family transporter
MHLHPPPSEARNYQRPVMLASLAVAVLMLVGKTAAWYITGSAAILSDALESVVHFFATGFAAFSLWYSDKPPDDTHPYGHGKVAYFSSGFEGALITIAALSIMYTAVADIIRGPQIEQLGVGLVITGGLALVNLVLGTALVHTGKKHNSIVLRANGQHVLTDVWTSAGVVVGLILVKLTGIVLLDPIVAILLALNIMWTAGKLMRDAWHGLMETADAAETRAIIDLLDEALQKGVIAGYHQLRHRRVHDRVWIEYHLLFPEAMSIAEAHHESHRVEDALHRLFPKDQVIVTAHLEPEAHDEAHQDRHPEPADDSLTRGS